MISDVDHVFISLLAISSLEKNICCDLVYLFWSGCLLLDIELYGLFLSFGYYTLYQINDLEISPIH